ncbi:MAG: hypothetical protein J0L70_14150 [Leptolyngbya sp. UWPOB_LEPTO1]|uniref:hypothetical protein n=1 Tax=Leptolyngbya sp. UWPOB_LEPTO1 TaxID=2815653 RepID=UPI001AD19A9E|nr:hypothetical protein [Leptolyngbya sp. UWPOB_LEPTO1]MBN8561669.1 hypothetical protein [Leptolyngbya sp. UWPOB_LEPTO1]
MNIQVLKIESNSENQWSVKLLIGQHEAIYPFTQEEVMIADRPVVGIVSDPTFRKFFKFNQHIISKITRLLVQKVNGESIEFPVEVGHFLTPDQAPEKVLLAE